MAFERYKEADPADTVRRAREILAGVGIVMRETMHQAVDGVYSVRLDDMEHGWSVNGKGTTAAFCMASGYGEALERLQGYFGYATSLLDERANVYLGFTRAPDERMHPIADCRTLAPDVWADMQAAWLRAGDLPDDGLLCRTWEGLVGRETGYVPYWSVARGETVPLPDAVIAQLVGSSGLASGNTPHEALCQGLCELFERYVQRTVHAQGLTLPDVPRPYIEGTHPLLAAVISRIEALGDYRVHVRDGSMGRGYPVVAVVLVDRGSQRYHVKFGAHPSFAVALERCLTELLEGYTPGDAAQDAEYLVPWTADPAMPLACGQNLDALFTSGAAIYPHAFFAGTPAWPFVPWPQAESFTNEAGVRSMVAMLRDIGGDVYVRDQGYLGFPAYRIYVPGVSTVFSHVGTETLRAKEARALLISLRDEACDLTQAQRLELLAYLRSDGISTNKRLTLHDGVPLPLAHAALLRDAGDLAGAARELRALPGAVASHRCAAMELELARQSVSETERDALLAMFFSDKILAFVRLHWRGESVVRNLFRSPFKRIIARGVKKYDDSVQDRQDKIRQLHIRIKESMRANQPDQTRLGALLE